MSLPQKNQLIIFARAPQYGRVKQRLARDIGPDAALRFYRNTLTALLERLRGGPWDLSISVAAQGDEKHPVFEGFETRAQPAGDLGLRMRSVLGNYACSRRIIIGSDIPAIQAAHVVDAFAALADHEWVFGPAVDGGFWLVGCSEEYPAGAPDHGLMRNVRWSTRHALADTVATLPDDKREQAPRVARVVTLADVDDGNSYQAFIDARGEICE